MPSSKAILVTEEQGTKTVDWLREIFGFTEFQHVKHGKEEEEE